ncbi:MFS transporter [Roseisolibacter sp. H3M3-2]|uniref:MFS transporter n=1 Tax=Roseisolibacter sp. H3M3-2 TaxID=3031323 RepID=UPI0023DB08BC|nr:MFS transporter [Roseisolibacter sp. H3M3-2]MDF1505658.1 MFS transporter [Roseisolibacter sp. H3M3-2]
MPNVLARLGLSTPALRAWAMYDWANSAIFTVVVTAVFPTYFARVPAAGLAGDVGTARYSYATTAALLLAVVLSPVVGAIGDARPVKKRLLATLVGFGALATAALALAGEGDWLAALLAFAAVNVAVNASTVVYDALLPHLARREELDRASSAGYALGYLGGGAALGLALLAILQPGLVGLGGLAAREPSAPTRVAFVGVALWWSLFSIPLLRGVPEPPVHPADGDASAAGGVGAAVREAFAGLAATLRALRAMPDAWRFLLAFILYNDAINTIIRMATVYGSQLGLAQSSLIGAILVVQFVGIPFAFAFGWLAGKVGAKRAILGALAVYGVITAVAYRLETERDFWVLAVLVAMVQGGAQALSRSLYASLVPASRSGEFFGLFSVFNRFGGMLGPLAMGLVTQVTGSSRLGIVSVLAFFLAGGLLLSRVDVDAGRRQALARDGEAGAAG